MVTLDSYFNLGVFILHLYWFSKICQSSLTGGDTTNKLTLEHSPFYPPTNVNHKQMSPTYTGLRNEKLGMNGKALYLSVLHKIGVDGQSAIPPCPPHQVVRVWHVGLWGAQDVRSIGDGGVFLCWQLHSTRMHLHWKQVQQARLWSISWVSFIILSRFRRCDRLCFGICFKRNCIEGDRNKGRRLEEVHFSSIFYKVSISAYAHILSTT